MISNCETLEIVAGMMDKKGENSMEAIKREIMEETGYEVDIVLPILDAYYYNPGKSNGKVYSYFAIVSKKVENGGGLESEHENIKVVELTNSEIKNSGIKDTFSLICLMKLNLI